MANRTRLIGIVVWTALVSAITVWNLSALVSGDTQQNFEIGMRHTGLLWLLSFPLGPLAWALCIFGLGFEFETAQPEIIFNSLLGFVAGLIQWFYLAPKAAAKWIKFKFQTARAGAPSDKP